MNKLDKIKELEDKLHTYEEALKRIWELSIGHQLVDAQYIAGLALETEDL